MCEGRAPLLVAKTVQLPQQVLMGLWGVCVLTGNPGTKKTQTSRNLFKILLYELSVFFIKRHMYKVAFFPPWCPLHIWESDPSLDSWFENCGQTREWSCVIDGCSVESMDCAWRKAFKVIVLFLLLHASCISKRMVCFLQPIPLSLGVCSQLQCILKQ